MSKKGSFSTIDSEFDISLNGEFIPIPERGEKTESAKIQSRLKNEKLKISKALKEI